MITIRSLVSAIAVAVYSLILAVPMSVPTYAWPTYLVLQVDGMTQDGQFGAAVGGVGDINGDGVADFGVGAPYEDPFGLIDAGSAYVYSGSNGAVLFKKDGAAAGDAFGYSISISCDLNGDGRADFLVGAPNADTAGFANAGKAYVYSGLDGTLLFVKSVLSINAQCGFSLSGTGDANGDGRCDFVVGAPGFNSIAGTVSLWSGANGSLIRQYTPPVATGQFGFSVADAGLVNGDTRNDVIIGAPNANGAVGAAYVYSPDNNTPIYSKNGTDWPVFGENFGDAVTGLGDIDGDGRGEFMIGEPGATPASQNGAGKAYLYSGISGAEFRSHTGTGGMEFFGDFLGAVGDVDGDTTMDYAVGRRTGLTQVFSGRTGANLTNRAGAKSVGTAGDLDGDSRSEVMYGVPTSAPMGLPNAGSVYIDHYSYLERILEIRDVQDDQGGWAHLKWKSLPGNDAFVGHFAIFRRLEPQMILKSGSEKFSGQSFPPGEWEQVANPAAYGDTVYRAIVPTNGDSTASGGIDWTVYFIRAFSNSNPLDYLDSPLDSGYSLDNLLPGSPTNLMANPSGTAIALDWSPSSSEDLDFYWIYRDVNPGFDLDTTKRIGTTVILNFLDESVSPGQSMYYRVSAVDHAGNESDPSNEASASLCTCPCWADPQCDGVRSNVQDVVVTINVAFRGLVGTIDPGCPLERTDVNASGFTNVQDVVAAVNVAFRGASVAATYVNPCQ